MPSRRADGSRPIVFIILVLLFVGAVCPARLPGFIPASIPAPRYDTRVSATINATASQASLVRHAAASSLAPRCNVRANSTINATVIQADLVRRAAANISAPQCNARANSTLNITVIEPGIVRRAAADVLAPRCNARANSTINATVIQVGRIRRADKPPSGQSSEHGSSGTPSDDDDFSDASSEKLPIDYPSYVQAGRLVDAYMRAPDAQITADLVKKGKLRQGEQLASRFKEVGTFADNGWVLTDDTPLLVELFDDYAPFRTALRALGLSDQARPQGKNELNEYLHTSHWLRNGRAMEPVGKQAAFEYLTNPQEGCLIVTRSYSTEYIIKRHRLDSDFGIMSPPLSHCSDMTFLEWKRACTKYNTDPKTLKHIIISVIKTDSTQQVVTHITGRTTSDWGSLPLWPQKLTFQPDSDEGKALLGTIQLKGIMWMLIQHREQLGKKAIKTICVFKDDMTGKSEMYDPEKRGPSLYVELEDVE